MLLVTATAAVLLDLLLGEPRRGHPLVLLAPGRNVWKRACTATVAAPASWRGA